MSSINDINPLIHISIYTVYARYKILIFMIYLLSGSFNGGKSSSDGTHKVMV